MAKQQRGLPGSQQCPSLKGPAEPWKPRPNPTPPPSVSLLLQNVCFPKERCSFLLVQGHHFPLVQGQCLGHRLALPIIVFFCLKTKPNKTNPKPGPRLAGQPGPLRTPQLASTVTQRLQRAPLPCGQHSEPSPPPHHSSGAPSNRTDTDCQWEVSVA